MKNRNCLDLISVASITNNICSKMNEDEWITVYVPVSLSVDNNYESFLSIVSCPKDEASKMFRSIQRMNGLSIEDYNVPDNYCHIATFRKKDRDNSFISFDSSDEELIHANYNDNFKYIESFFKSFISFRNNLMDNGQVVKYDDLDQYYCSVFNGFESNKKKKSFFKKGKK